MAGSIVDLSDKLQRVALHEQSGTVQEARARESSQESSHPHPALSQKEFEKAVRKERKAKREVEIKAKIKSAEQEQKLAAGIHRERCKLRARDGRPDETQRVDEVREEYAADWASEVKYRQQCQWQCKYFRPGINSSTKHPTREQIFACERAHHASKYTFTRFIAEVHDPIVGVFRVTSKDFFTIQGCRDFLKSATDYYKFDDIPCWVAEGTTYKWYEPCPRYCANGDVAPFYHCIEDHVKYLNSDDTRAWRDKFGSRE